MAALPHVTTAPDDGSPPTSPPPIGPPPPTGGAAAATATAAPAAPAVPAVLPPLTAGDGADSHDGAGGRASTLSALFDREALHLHHGRHTLAIRLRYLMVAVSLLLAVVDWSADIFSAPWTVLLALPLLTGIANVASDWLHRHGLARPWHFWAMLLLDTLVISGVVAVAGTSGYLAIPFFIVAAASYAHGQPQAARVQLALAAIAYPACRVRAFHDLGRPVPIVLIALEALCLAGLGMVAIQGPIGFTYRLRRTRRALAALERGDFTVRVPTRARDDLGFLIVSLNATAVALGDMVRQLTAQIAERQRAEAQLAHQAYHDALTGLANRVLFRDRVRHALERAGRQAERVTVLFVDLDGFKRVNDSLGHLAGDRLLVAIAERLLNATRGCDTVARLGGDEFAVLLENVREDADAIRVAERVADSLANPVYVDGAALLVSASTGIARASLAETEGGASASADELLRDADVAMYCAKAQGKGRYAIFEPRMHEMALERLALEAELRQALDREEFRLLYQPVVELEGSGIIGVEALVRWQHPTRGTLGPDVFIPVAEETGMIVPLGRWILRQACLQCATWRREHPQAGGPTGLGVAINVSSHQLLHPSLPGDVAAALDDAGLDPQALLLEITESALVQDTPAVLERLRELKLLGLRLAVDDFGTGYSSLSYLRRLPVDVLKIDKTFIDGLGHGRHDIALTRTIIGLGATLALRCVAEGVEDAEQQAHLKSLGCELGQGYLFARPLEADAVAGLLGPG